MIGSKGLNLRGNVAWKDLLLIGELLARGMGEERMCDVRFEVRGSARRRRICAMVAGGRELQAQSVGYISDDISSISCRCTKAIHVLGGARMSSAQV